MNILLLTTHFNEGGISRYCLNLGKELAAKGNKIYVASGGGGLEQVLSQNNIEHIRLNLRTKSELSPKIWCALFQLKKPLKEKNIQLIHAQTRVTQVLAYWIYKFYKIPYLSTCHGFFKTRLSRRVFPCWGERVIAISQAVENHLIKDFKASPSKVVYIPNGLDLRSFSNYDNQTRQDFRNQLRIDPQELVIGIVARLSTVKGHKFLIKAIVEVIREFPRVKLLIVGDGPLKNELIKLTEESGISQKVIFLPSVLETSLVLSILDIFVMPSLQEGLGLSIMEAMAMGIPVIATSVGGIPDLIKDRQTGILVPSEDSAILGRAIINLLKDKDFQEALGKNARNFIQQSDFSVQKMAQATEEVYQGVLIEKD